MNAGNRGCLERFWGSLDTAKGHNQIAARSMSPLDPETEIGARRAVLAQTRGGDVPPERTSDAAADPETSEIILAS